MTTAEPTGEDPTAAIMGEGDGSGVIVMATRNRADRAAATIERLLGLADQWPVIVVDDASTDGTGRRLRRRFGSTIEVISLEENRGASARNVGARAAPGVELVAFADDDSWWDDGALGIAARILSRNPAVALVAPTVLVEPGGEPDPIVADYLDGDLPAPPGDAADRPSILGFLACGTVVRRSAFLDVGGFHPLLGIGAEEQLLAMDLRVAGWVLIHVREMVARHAPSSSDGGREVRPVMQLRNETLTVVMRRSRRTVARRMADLAARSLSDPVARRALGRLLVVGPRALVARRRLPTMIEHELRHLERSH